jgi:hypothetical protein
MARPLRRIGTVCLVLLPLAGCGDKSKPGLEVRGQVLYRGDPVAGGLIVFAPNPERGSDGPVLLATLQEDGTFLLAGPGGQPVPAGWYRIAIAPRAGTLDTPTPERPYPGLPARYRNPALSGLEREIKPGVETVIALDLDDS